MPNSALPQDLKGKKHWDWPWPFKLIPRAWTAYNWGPPKLLAGKAEMESGVPKPVNPAGTFQISYYPGAPWWAKPFAWFVGVSGKKADDGKFSNFRIGARWDNVDHYTNCTFVPLPSRRRFTGDDSQDTSTNGGEK
jgi:hypothetical protein